MVSTKKKFRTVIEKNSFYFFNEKFEEGVIFIKINIKYMSLKAEQKINGIQVTEFEPRIYTTGAYLVPLKVAGRKHRKYVWAVEEFNNDSYADKLITPRVVANSIRMLAGY